MSSSPRSRRRRAPDPHAGLPVPAPLRREIAALLDQQMWCWGLDIRREEGNALICYGFRRVPVAEGVRGSSAYAKDLGPGRSLVLWGSGLMIGDAGRGAVSIGRFEFRLSFCREGAPTPAVLGSGAAPDLGPIGDDDASGRAWSLVASAFEAIIAYEAWAARSLGLDYRRRCVDSWPKRRTPADQIVPTWQALADRWRASAPSPILPAEGPRGANCTVNASAAAPRRSPPHVTIAGMDTSGGAR